jgi:hypothetical protein
MATLEVFDRTWKALRQSGALNTLLINELVPVPDISTASSLGLFSVFVKSKVGNITAQHFQINQLLTCDRTTFCLC